GLSAAMPSTALVTGVELLVDYKIHLLVRSKNIDVSPEGSNPNVIFDVLDGGRVESILLNGEDTEYTQVGSPIYSSVPIKLSDFDTTEDGTSEGKRWTVMEMSSTASVTIGSSNTL